MTPTYAVIVASSSTSPVVVGLCLIGAMSWAIQAMPKRIAAWCAALVLIACISGAAVLAVAPRSVVTDATTNFYADCGLFGCWFDELFW